MNKNTRNLKLMYLWLSWGEAYYTDMIIFSFSYIQG